MGSPLSKPLPKSQVQMCETYLAQIKESPVYDKFGEFRFYYATEGEIVETFTNAVETTNTAKLGDVVLIGSLGEKYIIGKSTFESRYEVLCEPGKQERATGLAKATGKINAIRVDEGNFEESFMPTWDEVMHSQLGGWYACPVGKSEVYFINEKAFEETYKLA